MKTKTFTDFEIDTISNKELKTIKGGDTNTPPEETVDPKKSAGGGNN